MLTPHGSKLAIRQSRAPLQTETRENQQAIFQGFGAEAEGHQALLSEVNDLPTHNCKKLEPAEAVKIIADDAVNLWIKSSGGGKKRKKGAA